MPPDESGDPRDAAPSQDAIELPLEALDPQTLRRVAEEIVSRDGTDYGAVEKSLDEKVENLLRELRAGRAALWFDPETSTTSVALVPPDSRGR